MKFFVKFDPEIGLESVQKQLSANESLENLQIQISLNYSEMSGCKIIYNNIELTDKDAKLRDIFDYQQKEESQSIYEIYVTKKGQLDQIKNAISKNPLVVLGVIVGVLLVILFIMGQTSAQSQLQEFY